MDLVTVTTRRVPSRIDSGQTEVFRELLARKPASPQPWHIGNAPYDIVTVTCNYRGNLPIRGRYVTLGNYGHIYPYIPLNLCEVDVMSCPPGTWGKDLESGDCSQPCGHCIEETCRVSDGHCYWGCQDGYWGYSCKNHCKNCADDGPCRMSDGYCYRGCTEGYWGPNCDEHWLLELLPSRWMSFSLWHKCHF